MKPALLRVVYDVGCPAAALALVLGVVWILRAVLWGPDDPPIGQLGLALTGTAIIAIGLLIAWRTRGAPNAH